MHKHTDGGSLYINENMKIYMCSYYCCVNHVSLMLLCHTADHIHSLTSLTNVHVNVNKFIVASSQKAVGLFGIMVSCINELRAVQILKPVTAPNACIQTMNMK